MRATREELGRLDLRAHALLADVPLHDAWAIDLPGGAGRTMTDFRALMSRATRRDVHPAVSFLFRVRRALGGLFGWDREPPGAVERSFLHELTPADRERSLVPPGTPEGPFRVLYVSPHEAISEIQNATVHAFSVFALVPRVDGCRLYWAIYVRPAGPFTAWYMRLIDPFRRTIIYPSILRSIRKAWSRPPE